MFNLKSSQFSAAIDALGVHQDTVCTPTHLAILNGATRADGGSLWERYQDSAKRLIDFRHAKKQHGESKQGGPQCRTKLTIVS